MCNKKKIKVILCGGGTGGHIFPMISVASQFRKVNKENEILNWSRLGARIKKPLCLKETEGPFYLSFN